MKEKNIFNSLKITFQISPSARPKEFTADRHFQINLMANSYPILRHIVEADANKNDDFASIWIKAEKKEKKNLFTV